MKKFGWLLVLWVLVGSLEAKEYADRWFYASFGIGSDADTEKLCEILQTAGKNGLNGMLWACSWERVTKWNDAEKERLGKIRQAAERAGVEIVPILWSVGYGTMLWRDNNLVEGGKVSDVPFIVKGNEAVFHPTVPGNLLKNGDFEESKGLRFSGYDFHEQPGVISFVDTEVKHGGKASLRMENFTADKHGHGRITQLVSVEPNRRYMLSIWYKTEGLEMDGKFRFQIYQKNMADVLTMVSPLILENDYRKANQKKWTSWDVAKKNGPYSREIRFQETEDGWKQARIFFQTGSEDTAIRLYLGIWDGEKGKFWLDDMELREVGMMNPLNRPGTPMTVKNAKTGQVYEEGRDFTRPDCKLILWREAADDLALGIPEGSTIADGTELLVSYYQPLRSHRGQVSVCMSEPVLYEAFQQSAREIQEVLAPKKWFLSMDEIRAGGNCQACKERGLTLGEILGDCITKQYNIIQNVHPGAEVYIWSDMLDPLHNCRAGYYACEGDFTGVCDHIPKELIISCWYFKIREESMKYFADKGFRTQAAAYYDKDVDPNWNDWLETCDRTPGCTGIMYTTWQRKYDLLVPFAKALKP
ncbi:MAG: carbohydrate binding domain-containing protein [Planctomycetia bacterium]|nr:carbohydrate binding domain-containing protein [Planctomycetia bacterium]